MTPTRIVRLVARMNIGGPALHLVELASGLDPARYDQLLVTGVEGRDEGSMLELATSAGLRVQVLEELRNGFSLGLRDMKVLARLTQLLRAFRPHIVETHTAKAGLLGRIAARAAGVPAVVHVFHGHVLHGYYGPLRSGALAVMERGLARISTQILTVSDRVKQDLVQHRVAAADAIDVVPLGFDLSPFVEARGGALRRELGLGPDVPLVGIVGRMFPIKNHRLFLDAAAKLRSDPAPQFVLVGDGDLRPAMEAHAASLGIGDRTHFLGWRRDIPQICADLDVLVTTSDNEGTPVTIIEGMAAGCPIVATRVGGIPDLVRHGESGLLTPAGDAEQVARAIGRVLADPQAAACMAQRGRETALARFSRERLVADMDALYRRLREP